MRKLMNLISMVGINKSYVTGENTLHVLKDVNCFVDRGEFLAILGASGSGKSTLMNIIGCMDTADSGAYHLGDISIRECTEAQLAKVRNEKIGFIFQKYHLIPQYNILQNVIMPLLIHGMSHKQAVEIAMNSIRKVGLEERLKHKPSELSGGQQQRVAIARALVTKPEILLADEPTGALDANTGHEILDLFQELNESGNTIIMITHDANVAKRSKRILHLDDGVITTPEG